MLRELFIVCRSFALAGRACADPLRIMPLGDSITIGSDDANLTPGGYRTTLNGLLDATGYDFDFVGSQQTNPGPMPDNVHEGYGGLQLPQIRGTMAAPLQLYQPDVVLLLGGTNDVTFSIFADPTLTAEGIANRLDTLLWPCFRTHFAVATRPKCDLAHTIVRLRSASNALSNPTRLPFADSSPRGHATARKQAV